MPATYVPSTHLALITGATGGIGRATAHALAAQGISVALHYHSSQQQGKELAREVRERYNGVRAEAFGADLGDYAAVRALHAVVTTQMGHPNILFLNAGTTCGVSGVTSLTDVDIDVFEQAWRVNVGANILLVQLSLPHLLSPTPQIEQPWGRIILTSSLAATTGGLVGPHYSSSKSALQGLIAWLSKSVARQGITVNGIAPALIAGTGMLPGKEEELSSKVPVGRLGRAEEVAGTVVWLVGCGYVTGRVVGVDGGMGV